MRVIWAADKMVAAPVSAELDKTLLDYWREKVDSGQMSHDKRDKLSLFLATNWHLWDQQKVHYFKNPTNPDLHFALGFTGKSGIMERYIAADKSHVQSLEDLAEVMHRAHMCE